MLDRLTFDPNLSYHGDINRVFRILGGKKKIPDLAKGEFYDPVQYICSNALAVDPINQVFECKGHAKGDIFYASFHGVVKSNNIALFKILNQKLKIKNKRDEFY